MSIIPTVIHARNLPKYGFTIVELLVVIVVIAVLAAITIVAYNGIQARATLTAQVAELDKIGQAVRLWSAENGKTLAYSGVGAYGQGYGAFQGNSASNAAVYPSSTSIQDMLVNAGYLPTTFASSSTLNLGTVLLAACTSATSSRWVVMATVKPAPQESATDQITDSGCTNGIITTYTGSGYLRNLVRAY